ncbi:hypothetical protein [Blastococcus mobilis]|uniref:Uncharacterized protein n=1 Tax=Blastococcus mobilis TaxID=1938746 RepID=A0A238VH47_9ACTN|nr:hypothetical protein [Blastococcus mobilis]SNR33407.1 hypothetical protein SAMN06272737_103130 [Blastococcus mobilis]
MPLRFRRSSPRWLLPGAALVLDCGARFLGSSVIVDQLEERTRARLGRVAAVVTREDLGDAGRTS